jgi:hypothetical protein
VVEFSAIGRSFPVSTPVSGKNEINCDKTKTAATSSKAGKTIFAMENGRKEILDRRPAAAVAA